MKPDIFFCEIVAPSLKKLTEWTGLQSDDRACVLAMAIAGQESNWQYRRQIGGPARSFWQFEQGGGVAGLLHVTSSKLQAVCVALDVPFNSHDIFEAMAWNDTLACCMARLLLWSDPRPLPSVRDASAGWGYYLANWRPGLPHPQTWPKCHGIAVDLMKA